MPRFLSPEWFEAATRGRPDRVTAGASRLVLEQHVTGAPGGDVRYLVVVADGAAWIELPDSKSGSSGADVSISVDYDTAAAIAQGHLSSQRALLEGRLRVGGRAASLAGRAAELAGVDPVPPALRAATTY